MKDGLKSKKNTDSGIDSIKYRLGKLEDIETITVLIQEAKAVALKSPTRTVVELAETK